MPETKYCGELTSSWQSIDKVLPLWYSPINTGFNSASCGDLRLRLRDNGSTLEYEATFKPNSRDDSGNVIYAHFLKALVMSYPGGSVTISNPGSTYRTLSSDVRTVTGSVTVSEYGQVSIRPNFLWVQGISGSDDVAEWAEVNVQYSPYEFSIPKPAPTIGITLPAGRVEAGRTASLNVTASNDVTSGSVTRYYRASSSAAWQTETVSNSVLTSQTIANSVPSEWLGYQVKWRYTASNGTETYQETPVYTVEAYDDSTAAISLLSSSFYEGTTIKVRCTNTGTVTSGVVYRYYQAKNSSGWDSVQIATNVTGRSTDIEDTIPENSNGGKIYWKYTVNGLKSSETAQKTIKANSPPTTPPSLTIPETISAEQRFTVQWEASTDIDNNLRGYYLDRSFNQGATWENVYNGPATSYSDKIGFEETTQVRYRVYACDDAGLISGYRFAPASGDRTVTSNHAPTIPAAPITVSPAVLTAGIQAVISWGASTDEDGDSFTYVLERSVDNGTFQKIYEDTAQQFTETVGSWETVTYRVKAVDSKNASSGYLTANAKTVSRNTAPTITCEYEDGANLGTKTELFYLPYSVNDSNASDVLTIKEIVDGVVRKTTNNAIRGEVYEFNFNETFIYDFDEHSIESTAYWYKLLNGSHTITISVSDGKTTVSRTFTFLKNVGACLITLKSPISAATGKVVDTAVVSFCANVPEGGITSVRVCSDGDQENPTWEDCELASSDAGYAVSGIGGRKKKATKGVNEALLGGNYVYIHKMTNSGAKFNFQIQLSKSNGVGGWISSVQGTFTEVNA